MALPDAVSWDELRKKTTQDPELQGPRKENRWGTV